MALAGRLSAVVLLAILAQAALSALGAEHGQKPDVLLANFTGTVTSITKSDLALEGDGGNALVFSISRHTQFLRNGRTVHRSAIRPGDVVSIQAGEDPTGHPSAITVTVGGGPKPKQAQPSR